MAIEPNLSHVGGFLGGPHIQDSYVLETSLGFLF